MFCRTRRRLLLLLLFCLAVSQFQCNRREQPVVQRLAVLPFDNLTSDPQLDWMSRAAAAALAAELAGARGLSAIEADSVRNAYTARVTRFVHSYFSARGGQLEARARVEDVHSHKSVLALSAHGPVAAGILPLVDQLARQLASDAKPFSTSNPVAFRAFADAVNASSPAARTQALEAATAIDRNFGEAYVLWAETLLDSGDREGAARVAAAGEQDHPSPIERAQLNFVSAGAKGKSEAQIQALKSWSALAPANAPLFLRLAQAELSQRKFAVAVHDYETAAKLDPQNADVLNLLGYAHAYTGDLEGARRSLAEYQKLLPEEVNPLDSLGEVSFYLGDFRSAENYFLEAHQKNPGALGGAELLKAAQARLMTGDLPQADAIFKRYMDFRRQFQAAFANYQQEQWQFVTGRGKDAMAMLRKSIPTLDADTSARALCQLSVWLLQTGDEKAAADSAQQAAARAVAPATRSLAALCRFIASHTATNSGSKLADALALLFQRQYQQAIPLLEAAYRETAPTADGQVRMLLAWALVETGNPRDAAPYLQLNPIPLASGDPVLASMVFPRIFYLKGAVLANQGKREDAKRNYEIYLKLAGDVPDIFGDEEKARKSL